MKKASWLILFSSITYTCWAQEVKVEYDKNLDFSRFKTFKFGESEIITPKDSRTIPDATLHNWIRKGVERELTLKGLTRVDSVADLDISYIVGSLPKTDFQRLGPLGTSPGDPNQIWSRDYQAGSLVIDLDDRNKFLIWRINASIAFGGGAAGGEKLIDQVVYQGFKKWGGKQKRKRK